MSIRTQPKRKFKDAINYHQSQKAELVALSWRMVEDDLQDTTAYRDVLAKIQRHERLITELSKTVNQSEFGGAS